MRQFLAEGPPAVREALGRPDTVESLFVATDATERLAELLAAARAAEVELHVVPAAVLASLAQTVTPQGVVAVCRFVDVELATALAGTPRLVAVLARVRDPGNAGTVIRAADAAGAAGVVLSSGSVDVYNGKCVRASAGSLFHLPVVRDAQLEPTTAALRAAGLTVLAADRSGALDLDAAERSGLLARPAAWVFGNEAWGLPASDQRLADATVRVPIYGRAESLNLAAAAAVCLYASALGQRRDTSTVPVTGADVVAP